MTDYNAAERKAIRAAEKRAKLYETQTRDTIRLIVSTPAGRAWFWERLTRSSVFHTTFVVDPCQTAFNEGRRSIGLDMLAELLAASPDSYVLMAQEAHARDLALNQEIEDDERRPD